MATNKPKPETEVRLEELQEQFLKNPNDTLNFEKFFILLKAYARSLTLKEIKTKIFLDSDHIDGIATEAVLKFLNQYKKPGWKVWGSFAGALRWKVVEALYENHQEESTQSLNALLGEESNAKEVGDLLLKIGAKPIWSHEGEDPQELFMKKYDSTSSEILGILSESSEVLTYRQSLLFHAYLLLRLRRPKTRLTLPSFKLFFLNTQEEEAFELLLLEIRNRLAAHSTY